MLNREQAERIRVRLERDAATSGEHCDDLLLAIASSVVDDPIEARPSLDGAPELFSRTRTRDFEAITRPIPIEEIRALASRAVTKDVVP